MINTNKKPMLSIIVAQAENRAIGLNGDMPWHLSGDLKRFKALTMGHPVVMGRRTWESLPKRPPVPPAHNRQKDSTEQASLMKPYYLSDMKK